MARCNQGLSDITSSKPHMSQGSAVPVLSLPKDFWTPGCELNHPVACSDPSLPLCSTISLADLGSINI